MTETTNHEPDRRPGDAQRLARRRGPDLVTLIAGLAALSIAVSALLGGLAWLPGLDARWVLAAIAMSVGLLLVVGSVRQRH